MPRKTKAQIADARHKRSVRKRWKRSLFHLCNEPFYFERGPVIEKSIWRYATLSEVKKWIDEAHQKFLNDQIAKYGDKE